MQVIWHLHHRCRSVSNPSLVFQGRARTALEHGRSCTSGRSDHYCVLPTAGNRVVWTVCHLDLAGSVVRGHSLEWAALPMCCLLAPCPR